MHEQKQFGFTHPNQFQTQEDQISNDNPILRKNQSSKIKQQVLSFDFGMKRMNEIMKSLKINKILLQNSLAIKNKGSKSCKNFILSQLDVVDSFSISSGELYKNQQRLENVGDKKKNFKTQTNKDQHSLIQKRLKNDPLNLTSLFEPFQLALKETNSEQNHKDLSQKFKLIDPELRKTIVKGSTASGLFSFFRGPSPKEIYDFDSEFSENVTVKQEKSFLGSEKNT